MLVLIGKELGSNMIDGFASKSEGEQAESEISFFQVLLSGQKVLPTFRVGVLLQTSC